ncbi:WD40 repeat-like protein [Backusella circina FSU 941]|nr:WD40 repeat-like protein [Backusella circina FSU 941]
MILEYFSSASKPTIEPTHSVSTQLVPPKKLAPTRSDSTVSTNKFISWISKQQQEKQQEIKKKPSITLKEEEEEVNVDFVKLYAYATKDLFYLFEKKTLEKEMVPEVKVTAVIAAATAPTLPVVESTVKVTADDKPSINGSKTGDKESNKSKVPTSVLPWKTRWKPSPEDKKNWNRFLSTNSEEMSKSMQFSFNDLKLRGFAGHNAAIRTFAMHEPLKLFASGSRDRTVKIWSLNIHDGIEHWETDPFSESLVTYTGHKRGTINDVHFLAPGLNDVVASCDGHVHIWDPNTGVGLHQFNTGRASVISAKPIFQSRHIVGGTMEGNITFFDAYNYTQIHTWKSSSTLTGVIRVIAVNQAETLVAVGFSTGAISLIESRTGTLVASWKGGDSEITLLKFYTDDILLSCATADHLVCCWNVNRLALVKTISAPQDITSLDIYKDEILTINGNNSVSFIPITDDFQAYSSKFKTSIMKSQVSSFGIIPTDQLILFGCAEGEIFLYA